MAIKTGFNLLTPEQRKAMASLGGKSVPPEKRTFSQRRILARECGKKGGSSVPPEKRGFSRDRELASSAGRKGGLS